MFEVIDKLIGLIKQFLPRVSKTMLNKGFLMIMTAMVQIVYLTTIAFLSLVLLAELHRIGLL